MRKRSMLLPSAVLALAMLSGAASAQTTIRNGLMMGATKADIIAAEGVEPDSNDFRGLVFKNAQAAGRNCEVAYNMDSDMLLTSCQLRFAYTNPVYAVTAFVSIDKSLVQKYGEPAELATQPWNGEPSKEDISGLGNALKGGKVKLISKWVVDDLYIEHTLNQFQSKSDKKPGYVEFVYYYESDDADKSNRIYDTTGI